MPTPSVCTHSASPASALLVCVGALTLCVACGADKNLAERQKYADELAAEAAAQVGVAGTGGADGDAQRAGGAGHPCPNNNTCLPDPGSRPVTKAECEAAEAPYEFFPMPLWDFQGNTAKFAYTYDDDTTQSLEPSGWEPKTILDPYDRCGRASDGSAPNHVLHLTGGQFLEWGGGFGRSLRCMNRNWQVLAMAENVNGVPTIPAPVLRDIYCDDPGRPRVCTDLSEEPALLEACPERDRRWIEGERDFEVADKALIGQSLDLSAWEGVSFWARRSPNSQPGIRVLVGDRFTDDDISYLQYSLDPEAPRTCERNLPCTCQRLDESCVTLTEEEATALRSRQGWDTDVGPLSADGAPTTEATRPYVVAGDQVCWNRQKDAEPPLATDGQPRVCGHTACRWPSASAKSLNGIIPGTSKDILYGSHLTDIQFADTTCREFSFHGSVTGGYCYNPKSDIPAQQHPFESSKVCGDHWMHPVTITTDWEFYVVPFSDLLQQGWAKEFHEFDLSSLTMARFTWDRGYIDYYLDDVRFYRMKK